MKSNVAQTSILAYYSLPDLNARQAQVLRTLTTIGPACNQQLADAMGLPINQVTGRVKELRDKGLVEEAYKDTWEPTGKTVSYWRAK